MITEDHRIEERRDIDIWLRRVATYAPIAAFIVGWGSGFMTAGLLYRDHEKRLGRVESAITDMSQKQAETIRIVGEILTVMEHKIHL